MWPGIQVDPSYAQPEERLVLAPLPPGAAAVAAAAANMYSNDAAGRNPESTVSSSPWGVAQPVLKVMSCQWVSASRDRHRIGGALYRPSCVELAAAFSPQD